MEKIRVLVLSNVEWSDENAFGNTMSNFFANNENLEIASLYRRNAAPNNKVCKKYYQISYSSIIKNSFRPYKIGKYFETTEKKEEGNKQTQNREKKLVRFIHKWKLTRLVSKFEGLLFRSKKWENKKYKDFIFQFNPDIIISFTSALEASKILIESVLKLVPSCKFVTFITDDVFGNNKSKKVRKNIEKQLTLANKIYAITPTLKNRYENIYSVNIDILRKGCNFDKEIIEKKNNVIKIVYAGNLLYGRENTIVKLVEEIEKMNEQNDKKIFLEVYSSTFIDDTLNKRLSVEGVSKFYGARPYNEIKTILEKADLVLHVESFDEKQQDVVRYSFSTKITDCLQCGSVLFAIGPKGLASIDMVEEMPGTVVVNDVNDIKDSLFKIINLDLLEEAKKTREYAKENYQIQQIQQKLTRDLKELCGK